MPLSAEVENELPALTTPIKGGCGIQLPRRLTVRYLRAVAEALKLPSTGSCDQLWQCIGGRLLTNRGSSDVVIGNSHGGNYSSSY